MTDSRNADVQQELRSPLRRRLLQQLAVAAIAGFPMLALNDTAEAGKRQRKQRRRKKNKQKQPPVQPAPNVRADATCPGPDTNGFPLEPRGVLAQSFTAGQTGLLVRATLRLTHAEESSATGNLFLRLAPLVDALPGPNALASAQVAATSVALGSNDITFTFADPAQITKGKSYALVLSRDGEGHISWSTRDGAACDGRSFITTDNSEPLEPRNDFDFIYTTFVQS